MAEPIEPLIAAIDVWDRRNWLTFDEKITDLVYSKSPEQLFFKKLLMESLSDDAKYVLKLVLDTPDEFVDVLYGQSEFPKKMRVRAFLKMCSWKPIRVEKVFKEITNFVKAYYGA